MPIPTKGFASPPQGTPGTPGTNVLIQDTDPGSAVGPRALWIHSSGTLKIRNAANTAWIQVSSPAGAQDLAQVLTVGDDGGGLGMTNLGAIVASSIKAELKDDGGSTGAADQVPTAVGDGTFGWAAIPVPDLGTVLAAGNVDDGGVIDLGTTGEIKIGSMADAAGATGSAGQTPTAAGDGTFAWANPTPAAGAPAPALMDAFAGSALMPWYDALGGFTAAVASHQLTLTASGGAGDNLLAPVTDFQNCRFIAHMTFGGGGDFDGFFVGRPDGTGIIATNFHGNLYVWHLTAFGSPGTPSAAGDGMGSPEWIEIEKRGSVYRARIGSGATFEAITWGAWLTTTNTFTAVSPLMVGFVDPSTGVSPIVDSLIVIPLA